MLVIGTFEHSIELEQALAVLEDIGIPRTHILAVPMDTTPDSPAGYIAKSRDRYYKAFEVGMASATATSVVGVSVGFILPWGPIFCALIVAFAGFFIGFGISLLVHKDRCRQLPKKLPEVTVIVQCPEQRFRPVTETLWKYRALTVGRIPSPS